MAKERREANPLNDIFAKPTARQSTSIKTASRFFLEILCRVNGGTEQPNVGRGQIFAVVDGFVMNGLGI